MSLIKSISGIRGTLGGKPGTNLTPIDAVTFAAAYGTLLIEESPDQKICVVIGRDARPSGQMVQQLVQNTLIALGIDVIDLGLSTTPTVAMAVPHAKAQGGIILTASHNPIEWNALKLLNSAGEFISAQQGQAVLDKASLLDFAFAPVEKIGKIIPDTTALQSHITAVLKLQYTQAEAVKYRAFKVVVDGVNSSGGIAIPLLLEQLGVETIKIHCEPNGMFPHNPEPLAEHLTDLSEAVVAHQADLGIAVDPDVDRLVFVDENGTVFGEEYTLVACADYVLSKTPGPTVSNLSSSQALQKVTKTYKQHYSAAAVGEVNVVEEMKKQNAIIGGEGNGGVILPELHYGRDALVGVALFLSHLVEQQKTASELRASYPNYFMVKEKVTLTQDTPVDAILKIIASKNQDQKINLVDGVKIQFDNSWVHLRKSNTEPIIRIYTEAPTLDEATKLAHDFKQQIMML
jgi:phosphomannomutase